jgi:hypothetical protein
LNLPGVGFCENNIKREGIVQYHMYNEYTFSDVSEVLPQLQSLTSQWDHTSVNELAILSEPCPTKNVTMSNNSGNRSTDWYHVAIRNNSKRNHAFQVCGYLARIINLATQTPITIPSIELIWSGLGETSVNILADTSRQLDALYVVHGEEYVRFHHRRLSTNNPAYCLPPLPPGQYEIKYSVVSATFETVYQWFKLDFDGSAESVSLIYTDAHDSNVS